ncbi:MAG: hypothetical protein RLZZ605_1383 [Bacteroidota bacterium]
MQENNTYESILGKSQSSDLKSLLQVPDDYFQKNVSNTLAIVKEEVPEHFSKVIPLDIPAGYFNADRFIPTKKKSIILQWSYLKWVAAASIVLFLGITFLNKHQKANTIAISSLSNDEIALYLQEHEWVSQSETIETYNLEQISETTLDELLKEQLNTL